ncbi:hypothetical protein AS030_21040 [Fictibacillus enclensis]|uniref:Uncharacterized protein n=1 Tax=Fictibacillus enclensis TaxID=1017270 RepID=A0A0V8IY28_9BACL|nr:hypothetical protein [Fictibacillus enclensis]KSU79742.1 hypothetical protein AS030_21040 [Fictibacillus enclensis]
MIFYYFTSDGHKSCSSSFSNEIIIPLLKDHTFFNSKALYGENKNGLIEKINAEDNLKVFKNKASFIVAKKAVSKLKTTEDFNKQIFSNGLLTTEYDLKSYGRTLYTELAKNPFSTFSDIMNFCNTWGLPTGITQSILEEKPQKVDINIMWMSLQDFFHEVHQFQKVFSYLKALLTDDYSTLPTAPRKGEFVDDHARRMLHEKTEEKSLFSYKMKSNIPITVFMDLFDAAYFYLNLFMENKAEMKICENYGHPFEVTHQRQRFCSALPGRKRSSCEMAYNNRLKKEKRKKGDK